MLWSNMPRYSRFFPHDAAVGHMAISRDGRRLATTTDKHARVWDLSTGQPVTPPLEHRNAIMSCEFSADGAQLITAGGALALSGEVCIWDIDSGTQMGEPIRSVISNFFYAAFTGAGEILTIEVPMSGNGTARLWSADDRQLKASCDCRPFAPTPDAIEQLVDAPRGRIFDRAGTTGRVIDLTDGARVMCELPHSDYVNAARFSHDGARVFTAEWNRIHVWDVQTGRELANYEGVPSGWNARYDPTLFARFSLDDSRVTIANDQQVMQLVVDGGRVAHLRTVPDVRYARPFVSGDGRFVAFVARDGAVRVWDVGTEATVASALNHPAAVLQALFVEDGRQLITACGDGNVRAWDLGTANGLRWYIGGGRATMSADGQQIVTNDDSRVWRSDAKSRQLISEFRDSGPPSMRTLTTIDPPLRAAGRGNGTVQVWDYVTGKPASPEIKHDKQQINVLRISPDGKYLGTIDVDSLDGFEQYLGNANVWEIETGRRVFGPFKFGGLFAGISGITCLEFSPDSRFVAVGGGMASLAGLKPTLKVIELSTMQDVGMPFDHEAGAAAVFSVAMDRHSRRLVSVTWHPFYAGKGDVCIWDLEKQRQIGASRQFADNATLVEIDPEGRVVAIAVGSQVHLLDLETGAQAMPPLVHDALVNRISFSPSGNYLATGAQDNAVRIWDLATGRRIGPPLPHRGEVLTCEFTPDGGLLTGCADGLVRSWGFGPLNRPLEDLARMARLLSAEDLSGPPAAARGAANSLAADWEMLRQRYPGDFEITELQHRLWHSYQATNCWNTADWLGAIRHFEQMAKVGAINYQNYGYMLCEAGRYDEGADQFDKSIELQPDDFWRWYIAAIARLRARNLPKYRETCEKMLARFRDTDNPQAAADVAKIILLGHVEDEPSLAVLELARRAMAKEAGHPTSPWIRLAKALADYRADRFDDSRAILEQLLKESEDRERYAWAKFLLRYDSVARGQAGRCQSRACASQSIRRRSSH
jgi:WD40 repeat protein/tetratricopeptide (TPR) repeat protein